MRMPRLHLVEETFRHVSEVERSTLLRHYTVEEDLQQQIAQLLAQKRVVAGSNRVIDLVRFLEQVRPKRLVRLRRVPFAAATQVLHQLQRLIESRLFLHRSSRLRILFSLHMIAHRAVR